MTNGREDSAPAPIDWRVWHEGYESDTPLRRRLEIVQRRIGEFLDGFGGSPVRVVSMCAGEGRDLLGALDRRERRDITGRLVELDPELADRARLNVESLGLSDISVVVGDAADTRLYRDSVPADLVLVCGVFGNISDEDIEKTLRALPMFAAHGATVIWTRHRREPDMTVKIRRWLEESGFENTVYEPVPNSDTLGTVGVARFVGQTQPLVDEHLFTFNRKTL
ncbi:MAG TPA: class I SAM-dependent methyltransferase family protein [Candidatus Limnocylindrales bacterium]